MKIVIEIKDDDYYDIIGDALIGEFTTREVINAVKNGTPLLEGAEILTKEAYSDLCTRESDVPNFESKEYIEQRLENYNNLLKSGILDCVMEESEDKK